jgi:hypothetical protein
MVIPIPVTAGTGIGGAALFGAGGLGDGGSAFMNMNLVFADLACKAVGKGVGVGLYREHADHQDQGQKQG